MKHNLLKILDNFQKNEILRVKLQGFQNINETQKLIETTFNIKKFSFNSIILPDFLEKEI